MQTATQTAPKTWIKESAETIEARKSRVFGAMEEFGQSLPNIRKAVAADLHSSNLTIRACAAIVSIIDQTTMRVGGAEYAAKNETYGASSMLKSHVVIEDETVSFSFVGKHHKSHCKTATGAALIEAMEFFLQQPGAKLFPVSETQVRAYLSQFNASPKMFRTYHASRLASELLEEVGAACDEKTARRNITSVCKQVSLLLGNSPAMARNSYIDPVILEGYAANI